MDIGFSIDMHDKEGDKFDDCLLIHFNDTFLLRLAGANELDEVIRKLHDIRKEIVENY